MRFNRLNQICIGARCERPAFAKGMCGKHYQRMAAHGTTEISNPCLRGIPVDVRFWSKVDITSTCWLWTGGKIGKGYGQFRVGNESKKPTQLVHRYVYELVRGPIPANLEIDHLCKVRHCVNPDHLEAVTRLENMLRSDNHIAHLMRNTNKENTTNAA